MICASPAASITRSKPPDSSARPASGVSEVETYLAPHASASWAFAVVPGERPAVHTSNPSRRRKYVDSMPIAPGPITSARSARHGWRSATARAWRIARAHIEAGSARTPSRPSERGTGTRCSARSATSSLANPSRRVIPRSSVIAGVAGVRRTLGARVAVPARPPHRRGDQVAAREAVAVSLDDAEQLVPEDEAVAALGGHAEGTVVRSRGPSRRRPPPRVRTRSSPARGPRVRELDDLCGVSPDPASSRDRARSGRGEAAVDDEQVPVTNAASSDAR